MDGIDRGTRKRTRKHLRILRRSESIRRERFSTDRDIPACYVTWRDILLLLLLLLLLIGLGFAIEHPKMNSTTLEHWSAYGANFCTLYLCIEGRKAGRQAGCIPNLSSRWYGTDLYMKYLILK